MNIGHAFEGRRPSHFEPTLVFQYEFRIDLNRAAPPVSEVAWATAHRYIDLAGEEEDFIEQLARMHGAYW